MKLPSLLLRRGGLLIAAVELCLAGKPLVEDPVPAKFFPGNVI